MVAIKAVERWTQTVTMNIKMVMEQIENKSGR